METIVVSILSAVGAGIVATIGTVKSLNVHIDYIKEGLNKLDSRVRELEIKK